MSGTTIGIHATLPGNFPPIPGIARLLYRIQPEHFTVIEVDTLGRLVPTSDAEAAVYQHPPEQQDPAAATVTTAQSALAVDNSNSNKQPRVTFREAVGDEIFAKLSRDVLEFQQQLLTPQSTTRTLVSSITDVAKCPALFTATTTTAGTDPTTLQLLGWVRSAVARELSPLVVPRLAAKSDDDNGETHQQQLEFVLEPAIETLAAACNGDRETAGTFWLFLHNRKPNGQEVTAEGDDNAGKNVQHAFTFCFHQSATKDDRRNVHELLRRFCDGRNARFTKQTRGTDAIHVVAAVRRPREEENSNKTGDTCAAANNSSNSNGNNANEFFVLVMQKSDVPAFAARRYVADFFRLPGGANSVQQSGTKDRRAVTFQRISVPATAKVREILQQKRTSWTAFHVRNSSVVLRCPQMRRQPLAMGQHHSGNVFRIKMKIFCNDAPNAAAPIQAEILRRVEEVRRSGFANFFGPQRFGVHWSTLQAMQQEQQQQQLFVGILIAAGKYEEAVRAIFAGAVATGDLSANDEADLQQQQQQQIQDIQQYREQVDRARNIFLSNPCRETVDAALKLLPSSASGCIEVLKQLRWCATNNSNSDDNINGLNYRAAIQSVSFEQRQMWVHAAQSLVFNEVLSQLVLSSSSSSSSSRQTTMYIPQRLALLGRKSCETIGEEEKQMIVAALRKFGIDSIESFCDECEATLGATAGVFAGTTRAALEFASPVLDVSFEEPDSNSFFVNLHCQLASGSFLSVLVRSIFGVFPDEP